MTPISHHNGKILFGEKSSAPYGHDVIYRLLKFDWDVRFHRGVPPGAHFFYRNRARVFNVFAYILETSKDFCSKLYKHRHVKHGKREPEGVHGQLEGFNRNLRPQAAVANNNHLAPKFSSGEVYYTSLIILSKSGPNRFSSSRENAKKTQFSVTVLALSR